MSNGYVFRPFPKCKYHPDGRVRVVKDAGEEQALGSDWSDRPVPPDVPVALPAPPELPPAGPELGVPGVDALTPPAPARRRGRPRKVQP